MNKITLNSLNYLQENDILVLLNIMAANYFSILKNKIHVYIYRMCY